MLPILGPFIKPVIMETFVGPVIGAICGSLWWVPFGTVLEVLINHPFDT